MREVSLLPVGEKGRKSSEIRWGTMHSSNIGVNGQILLQLQNSPILFQRKEENYPPFRFKSYISFFAVGQHTTLQTNGAVIVAKRGMHSGWKLSLILSVSAAVVCACLPTYRVWGLGVVCSQPAFSSATKEAWRGPKHLQSNLFRSHDNTSAVAGILYWSQTGRQRFFLHRSVNNSKQWLICTSLHWGEKPRSIKGQIMHFTLVVLRSESHYLKDEPFP